MEKVSSMDADPIIANIEQPDSNDQSQSISPKAKALPGIWEALESLTSPDLMNRIAGLGRITELNGSCRYPLVIYVLVSRITEPDIELRMRIVKLLGKILGSGSPAPKKASVSFEAAKKTLISLLSGMRTRQIFALLQVSEFDKTAEAPVSDLLAYCSFAGGHLARILSNRTAPLSIRRQAAHFIGIIGYLDALPALERLAARLETRKDDDDLGILPGLQETIKILYSP